MRWLAVRLLWSNAAGRFGSSSDCHEAELDAVSLTFNLSTRNAADDGWCRRQQLRDTRVTQEGVLVLKVQQHRSQKLNRSDAMARLQGLVDSVAVAPRARGATKRTYGCRQRRLEAKSQRSAIKQQRGPLRD